ncbi:EpsG family protein [Flaviflexus huanghaiensis]|uniref:EpsG family protein n=1 Tax=Flaviflexus huanghaiensis TaxID=1111473 RepID=UPI0015F88D93
MNIYLAVFVFLIAADIFILQNQALIARRGIFVILATAVLAIQSGLRHESIGGRDVFISYKRYFNNSHDITWNEIIGNLFSIDILVGDSTEPGFLLFVKLVSTFTDNYQVMIFVMSLVFILPFGWLVYRYSADPFISFVVYYVLFFSFFSLTGFRQTIATVIAVLLSYPSVLNRKPLKFALFIAIGFLFHRSALIYALIYPVSAIPRSHGSVRGAWLIGSTLVGSAIVLAATGALGETFGYAYAFENDIGGTATFTTLMGVVFIAFLIRRKSILESSNYAYLNMSSTGLGAGFALMTLISQSFMRVQQYFSLLVVLSIPDFISSFSQRDRVIVRIAVISVLFLLLIRADSPYRFFWEV